MSNERKPEPAILTELHKQLNEHIVPDWIVKHLEEYARDPDKAHYWDGSAFGGDKKTPCLLLTTKGRKSGRMLTMPLIYGTDGANFVIVGSKGGAAQNPAWVFNLEADPNVGVQVARDRFDGVARTAKGSERARLWEMMVGVYPPYRDYQARTEREIPVVVLSRK